MKMSRKMKREAQKEFKPLRDLLKVMKHYYSDLIEKMDQIDDPRSQCYITYDQTELLFIMLLAHCCHLRSMRKMNDEFNHSKIIRLMNLLFSNRHEEIPHGDTINLYLEKVPIDQLRELLYGLFDHLMKKRITDAYRISGKYHQLILDGVNMYSFTNHKHVEGSIEIHHQNGDITYKTDMIVACFSLENMLIPIDIEAVENDKGEYDKQDCEIKAAKRLIMRIKDRLKRLPICLSADALYFSEPMLEMIEAYHWKYIIRYKEGCASSVQEYYDVAKKYNDISRKNVEQGKTELLYAYYNGIEYRAYQVNLMEIYEKNNEKPIFSYVTNFELKDENIEEMANRGRKRWKIENKAFNELKNHGYYLRHPYSYHENGIKAHLIIMLLAQAMMNLLLHYIRTKKMEIKHRSLGDYIKEALRLGDLSADDVREIACRMQVRTEIPY